MQIILGTALRRGKKNWEASSGKIREKDDQVRGGNEIKRTWAGDLELLWTLQPRFHTLTTKAERKKCIWQRPKGRKIAMTMKRGLGYPSQTPSKQGSVPLYTHLFPCSSSEGPWAQSIIISMLCSNWLKTLRWKWNLLSFVYRTGAREVCMANRRVIWVILFLRPPLLSSLTCYLSS